MIGSKPSNKFKKIDHLNQMLSLSNAFNKNGMIEYLKKNKNFLNYKNQTIEFFLNQKLTEFLHL